MSQDDTNLDELEEQADNLKHLREQAAENKATKAENAKQAKTILFLRAGIDLDSEDERTKTLGTMLFNSFDGDDLDALKTQARTIGLLDPPNAGPNDSDLEQQGFRRDLSRGQTINPNDVPTPDPHEAAIKKFHEDRQNGVQLDDAQFAAIDDVFMAAAKGDKRATFDPDAWERKRQAAGHGM